MSLIRKSSECCRGSRGRAKPESQHLGELRHHAFGWAHQHVLFLPHLSAASQSEHCSSRPFRVQRWAVTATIDSSGITQSEPEVQSIVPGSRPVEASLRAFALTQHMLRRSPRIVTMSYQFQAGAYRTQKDMVDQWALVDSTVSRQEGASRRGR